MNRPELKYVWQSILKEKQNQSDNVSILGRLFIAALGGMYIVYIQNKVHFYYGTYLLLMIFAYPAIILLFRIQEKFRFQFRLSVAIIDSIGISLYLYGFSLERVPEYPLYSSLFFLYFLILIGNSYRFSPIIPIVIGILSSIGFITIVYMRSSFDFILPFKGTAIHTDLLLPIQQITKVILLLIASILLSLFDNFNLSQLRSSLGELLQKIEIDKDLDLASSVQKNLIPPDTNFAGIHMVNYFETARRIGGDYFDIVQMRDGHLGLFIADVSGHGVSSALIATSLKVVLQQAETKLKKNPVEMLAYLDDYVTEQFKNHHMTAQYYYINPDIHRITMASGGHPFPIFIRENQTANFWQVYGSLLGYGLYRDQCALYTMEYNPSDRLILYTDGLLEAMNQQGDLYGYDKLLQSVQDGKNLTIRKQLEFIVENAKNFHFLDALEDDVAIAIIEFTDNFKTHENTIST